MEDPSHYLGSTRNNRRRRDRIGGNAGSGNPSSQEIKNGPRQADSGRRSVEQDRNLEGPERDYKNDKRSTKTR
jgi:hypothetical protein